MRDRRLRQVEARVQVAHAQLRIADEQVEDPHACRVGEGLEALGDRFGVVGPHPRIDQAAAALHQLALQLRLRHPSKLFDTSKDVNTSAGGKRQEEALREAGTVELLQADVQRDRNRPGRPGHGRQVDGQRDGRDRQTGRHHRHGDVHGLTERHTHVGGFDRDASDGQERVARSSGRSRRTRPWT